jgi:ferredoxin--NADP+ reductase
MFPIRHQALLTKDVTLLEVEAPRVARKAKAGHFVVVRVDERGERIPLTIADWDRDRGTVTLVVQAVGKTSRGMLDLRSGDALMDLAGPLGIPTEIGFYGAVVCIGGGIGRAPIYPIARAQREAGNRVITIVGARNASLVFWVDRLTAVSDELLVATDDGSLGRKGLVTDELRRLIDEGTKIDLIYAVGPAVMMRAVCEMTRPCGIRTLVSLNPIMVDGTGMCGGCRVTVGGVSKFACVHGPEFDGHQVDFDGLMKRQRMYRQEEKLALEKACAVNEKLQIANCKLQIAK